MEAREHELIECIYRAGVEPEAWQAVAETLSKRLDDAACMIAFLLPGEGGMWPRYTVGLDPDYVDRYTQTLFEGVPWSTKFIHRFVDRFGTMGEVLGHVDLAASPFYREWLEPQGLGAVWPAGHSLIDGRGEVAGGISFYRQEGRPDFTDAELAELDAFVPHLRRAFQTHLALHAAQMLRGALAEAVDLLPTGLILLDQRRNIVLKNRGADRILKLSDGVRCDGGGPSADDARENAELQVLIADALDSSRGGQAVSTGFLAISRPSGKKSFATMVAPLLGGGGTVRGDAAVAILIADPDAGRIQDSEVLAALYSLTHSEAELVRLLSEGLSLEEVAERRGVSMNTARSHLKHVFAKTGTSRQGELLRLVLSGAGSIGEE